MESSSGEDEIDDWKPRQDDSDDDSQESEEEVTQRVPDLPKKKTVKRNVLQRQSMFLLLHLCCQIYRMRKH